MKYEIIEYEYIIVIHAWVVKVWQKLLLMKKCTDESVKSIERVIKLW